MEKQLQGSPSILLVDDDPAALETTATVLKKEGFDLFCALDRRQCLEHAHLRNPDLILMDVVTPRLDGIALCRELKADPDLKAIPVLFSCTDADDPLLETALNAGGSDFICKPFKCLELLLRIRLLLDRQRTLQKRAETEKLQGVLETAGGVCHTLNQPLQYVLGAVQILLMDIPPDDNMYKSLDAVRQKVEQMGEITRKLAEVTRYRTKTHAGGRHILDIERCGDGF